MKVKKSTPAFKLLATLGLSVIGVSAFAVPSNAALFYNEIVDAPGGDLSNNRLNPNFIGAFNAREKLRVIYFK